MEFQTAKDEAARSTEILHQANVYLEQVKVIYFIAVKARILTTVQLHFQTKPEIYKELFHLLNSYATARDEAHRHISTQVQTIFHGTAPELPRLRHALTRTVRIERGTPYAAALVNSAVNRVTKTTIESTAAEDSSEEIIEESAMKTTTSMTKTSQASVLTLTSSKVLVSCCQQMFIPQLQGAPWQLEGHLGSTEKRGKGIWSLSRHVLSPRINQ
jgi:hypothetical protein